MERGFARVPDIIAGGVTAYDWAVFRALCRHVFEWDLDDRRVPIKGACDPSIETITEMSGCSKSSVCRALAHLEELRVIFRDRGDYGHSRTKYELYPLGDAPPPVAPSPRGTSAHGGLVSDRDRGECPTETGIVSHRDRDSVPQRQGIVSHRDTNTIYYDSLQVSYEGGTKAPAPPSDQTDDLAMEGTEEGALSEGEAIDQGRSIPTVGEGAPDEGAKAPAPRKARKAAKARRPEFKTPLEGAPYDERALETITELYELCPGYLPDWLSEKRMLQDLQREHPDLQHLGVDLYREIQSARDWVDGRPENKRPKQLRRFLRNWIDKAVKFARERVTPITGGPFEFIPIEGGNEHDAVKETITA